MIEPRVSIIINNFNYARFLRDAIDSALAQTYPNVEIIVVDDGSTDTSVEVIASYGDKIIPVLKENGGQGSAYNAGYASSSGNIVCFLDSDDTLDEQAMAAAVDAFRETDVAKVQWPMFLADASGRTDGRITTVQSPPDGSLLQRVAFEGPLYDFNYHTNCALARSFLEAVMPVPEPDYRISADEYLTTLAPVYGAVTTLPKAHGTYRVHGANNYVDRNLDDDRVKGDVARFESNACVLADHLNRRGIEGDAALWKETAFNYLWPTRLLKVRIDIRRFVPEGSSYLLIDDEEWGGSTSIDGRLGVRLIERDGDYWGPPEHDAVAIEEIRRHFANGVRFLVLWWTCTWWRDVYPGLFLFLEHASHRVVESDGAVIFELTSEIGAL